jgi:hypothetical protein
MSTRRLYLRTFGLTVVVLVLAGCGGAPTELTAAATAVPPTATPTLAPPTATSTLIPPTATPTPEPPTSTLPPPTPTSTPVFTLATSPEEIAGTWQKTIGAGCIRFQADGSFRQARRRDALDDSPFAICEIWFEGTQLFVGECTVSGVPPCGDAIAIYEVRLLDSGELEIVAIKDDCSPRRLDTATVYSAVP